MLGRIDGAIDPRDRGDAITGEWLAEQIRNGQVKDAGPLPISINFYSLYLGSTIDDKEDFRKYDRYPKHDIRSVIVDLNAQNGQKKEFTPVSAHSRINKKTYRSRCLQICSCVVPSSTVSNIITPGDHRNIQKHNATQCFDR